MKKKMNFSRIVSAHLRGMKELHKVSHQLFPTLILCSVLKGIIPYVTVFFSAQILTELSEACRADILWKWVVASVAVVGVLSALKSITQHRYGALFDDVWGRKEILFCRKSFSILYDDTELRNISSGNLYEIESIIQQNVFVFNATIKDNITMFRDFSEEQIDEAIRLSGLSALIEEKAADYLCGENGSGLSGGEKQRISIARSLLKKSQVLLVDEATAALDAETAYQVSTAILGLKDITSIVVTHALDEALLKRYDGIITLKNGSIVETGTFDELIAEKGYFYSLFTISQ